MSIDGRLEDFGVSSLLQLIGLGKISGTLALQQSARRGGLISFNKGQVVMARSSTFPERLGELLLGEGIAAPEQIEHALTFQYKLKKHQPFGVVLKFFHPELVTVVDRAIVGQLERIVADFCSWTEGSFSFSQDSVDGCGSIQLNPLDLILERGFCPLRVVYKGDEEIADIQLAEKMEAARHRRVEGRVDLLRAMLTELQRPEVSGGILLLILRYASELMNRGILFDVRGSRLVGLGQFGLPDHVTADRKVRRLDFDLTSDPLLLAACRDKKIMSGTLNCEKIKGNMRDVLGILRKQVYVAPLVSNDRVVALLFGDGIYPFVQPAALDAFATFLSQSGVVMEQAFSRS